MLVVPRVQASVLWSGLSGSAEPRQHLAPIWPQGRFYCRDVLVILQSWHHVLDARERHPFDSVQNKSYP